MLNQAAFGSDVIEFTKESGKTSNTGQFVAAIDISAFGPPEAFRATASKVFEEFRASTPLPGHDPVRLPGDGKFAQIRTARRDGIHLHPSLRADLDAFAAELGVAPIES